jgi:hypothetical protein
MTCAARVAIPTTPRPDVRRFAVGVVVAGGAICAAEGDSR